jgi:hypothetical protein
MKCEAVSRKLLLYVSGDLDRRSARAVEEHLKHCPACQQELRLIKESLAAIRQADLEESQKLPEWDEERWADLMSTIVRGESRVPGKSISGLFSWKKPALAAAAVAGLILVSFFSYHLIDRFWLHTPSNKDIVATGQQAGKISPAGQELKPETPTATRTPDTASISPRQVELPTPSRLEEAKPRARPSEKIAEAKTAPVPEAGEKAGVASTGSSELQPASRPERVEMSFILPESGVQVLWILDRNINLEGVKK